MNTLKCPVLLTCSLLGIILVNGSNAQASHPKTLVKSLDRVDPVPLTKERSPLPPPPVLEDVPPQNKQARPPEEDEEEDDDDVVEITITATRTRRPVQTTPLAIDVIDGNRIERESIQDIRDLVRYTPRNFRAGQFPLWLTRL